MTHRFPRHRRSVGRARQALRRQLAIWHVGDEVTEFAVLVLSELVTNAVNVETPRGRKVGVRFVLADAESRVEVADASDELPVLGNAGDEDESGRGPALVEALADRWGVWGVKSRAGVGKAVWVLLVLPGEGVSWRW